MYHSQKGPFHIPRASPEGSNAGWSRDGLLQNQNFHLIDRRGDLRVRPRRKPLPLIKPQRALIFLGHLQQQAGAMRALCLALGGIQQNGAEAMIAVAGIDRERIDIEARRRPLRQRRERAQALAQAQEFGRFALAGQPVAQHHAGDMAVQLADESVFEAERLIFEGKAAGGEIDELPAPGLSGEAGRRIAGFDDQVCQTTSFTLTRCAQNGLLLAKSISKIHAGPERG
jgi:hypothetical protein